MSMQVDRLNQGETWVVVANASRADIYRRNKKYGPLETVLCLREEHANAKEQELVADEPGRAFDRRGRGRHVMEPPHSEKDHLLTEFAHRIARVLESARREDQFAQLVIIAAPAMLGELRQQIDSTTAAQITAEFDKELIDQNPQTIAKLLDS